MDTVVLNESISEWLRQRSHNESRESTSRFRMSQAGKCRRQIAFEARSFPRDLPLTDATLRNFAAGDVWHELCQAWLADSFGAECEVECELKLPRGEIMTGHADALVVIGERREVWEIKSMAPYSWDLAVKGTRTSEPEGVRSDHVLQASLYAVALKAQTVVVGYVNRATGEWATEDVAISTSDVDNFLLQLDYISGLIDSHLLPARVIDGKVIESPDASTAPWQCRYCPWQPTCSKMQSGLVSQ